VAVVLLRYLAEAGLSAEEDDACFCFGGDVAEEEHVFGAAEVTF